MFSNIHFTDMQTNYARAFVLRLNNHIPPQSEEPEYSKCKFVGLLTGSSKEHIPISTFEIGKCKQFVLNWEDKGLFEAEVRNGNETIAGKGMKGM